MLNLNFKLSLLNNGVYDWFKLFERAKNRLFLLESTGFEFDSDLIPFLSVSIDYYFLCSNFFTKDEFNECVRISNSLRQRAYRLHKKIGAMLTKRCLFLTLTFDDEHLLNTLSSTRKRYVRDYLSKYNVPCIANKDFGKQNGREHYHAIIQTHMVNPFDYKYGSINFERVRVKDGVSKRLGKYITKITNHALKESTQNERLIYLHLDKLCEVDYSLCNLQQVSFL